MTRHQNVIYVTTQRAWLNKDGQNVVVSVDGAERARMPVHQLAGIVGFGRVALSAPLLGFCCESGITVTHLDERGRFLARVEGPVSGNVLLRREQYRRADDPDACAALVRSIVTGKTLNQRAVLRRALRDHREAMPPAAVAALEEAERRLTDIARRCAKPQDTDALRGLEGEAGAVYFAAFPRLIRRPEPELTFATRSRRPPLDAVNALLSFLYALLTHDLRAACETVGLDPQVGFLHRLRPGRPSLALDLVEEFRPWLADRTALSLLNRRQLDPEDFSRDENGGVRLANDARRTVLVAWQERKREAIRHVFLGEPSEVGLIPHLQAQLLARTLRGDLDLYPPFVWK